MSKFNLANLKKTAYYFKRNGFKDTLLAISERTRGGNTYPYDYVPVEDFTLEKQRKTVVEDSQYNFTISIVVPTYHTKKEYLVDLLDSLLNQSNPNWELILADASADASVRNVIDDYQDERIKYHKLSSNEGISGNTNEGLKLATGSYIGLLDHDDVLTFDAVYEVAKQIVERKKTGSELEFIYSDEDKCNSDRSQYYEYHSKEDYNLDLILSNNYICHFLVMKAELMKELGFRREFDGAQDYDLVLRAMSKLKNTPEKIAHIDKVLYHWRCHSASTAENPASKQYAYEAGKKALQAFADREGIAASAEHLKHLGFYKLKVSGDIFETRNDIAVIGGPIYENGLLAGGRMAEDGECFYQGSKIGYSGYMHRMALTQDAYALDIRNIRVAPEFEAVFEETVGCKYVLNAEKTAFDYKKLPEGCDIRAVSLKLAENIRQRSNTDRKLFLYDPDMFIKI